MKNNMNDVLIDNNQKMKSMDADLTHTVNDVNEINEMLTDTNTMLVDQTGKLQKVHTNNKDITHGYR